MKRPVEDYRDLVEKTMYEFDRADFPLLTSRVLALIDVESDGDDCARRKTKVDIPASATSAQAFKTGALWFREYTDDRGQARIEGVHFSQFCGLLQMGRPAGIDVGFRRRGYLGWDTTEALVGDPDLALHSFYTYVARYEDRHDWSIVELAVLWKGGPGTASSFKAFRERADWPEAAAKAAKAKRIPGLVEYIHRAIESEGRYE